MKTTIPFLKKGDTIAIVAPAKAIDKSYVDFAKTFLEEKGFVVFISEHCLGSYNYFSGTLFDRLADFQNALDNPEVKAILCARGGYGCVQLVDKVQWASFLRFPKWIVGFSDITVFHQRAGRFDIQSIHGTMPLNFEENSSESLDTLVNCLKGNLSTITFSSNSCNKLGTAQGKLVGGNFSILYSLLGTDDQIDYTDTILFIEDLSEQLYHLDRMLYSLDKAGVLDKISGLIVGGMTDMKDTIIPYGMSYEEIILSHFEYRNIPVCFDFPAGHINDNRALLLGSLIQINITEKSSTLDYL